MLSFGNCLRITGTGQSSLGNRVGQLSLDCRLRQVVLGSRLWASIFWMSGFQIRDPGRLEVAFRRLVCRGRSVMVVPRLAMCASSNSPKPTSRHVHQAKILGSECLVRKFHAIGMNHRYTPARKSKMQSLDRIFSMEFG